MISFSCSWYLISIKLLSLCSESVLALFSLFSFLKKGFVCVKPLVEGSFPPHMIKSIDLSRYFTHLLYPPSMSLSLCMAELRGIGEREMMKVRYEISRGFMPQFLLEHAPRHLADVIYLQSSNLSLSALLHITYSTWLISPVTCFCCYQVFCRITAIQ